jgi:hypothetical protein
VSRTQPHEHTRFVAPPPSWHQVHYGASALPLGSEPEALCDLPLRAVQVQPPAAAAVLEHLRYAAYRAEGLRLDLASFTALLPGRAASGLLDRIRTETDFQVSLWSGGLAPAWTNRGEFTSRVMPRAGHIDHVRWAAEIVAAANTAAEEIATIKRAPSLHTKRRYDLVRHIARARFHAHNLAAAIEPSGETFEPIVLSATWQRVLFSPLPERRPGR